EVIALRAVNLALKHGEDGPAIPQAGEAVLQSLLFQSFLSVARNLCSQGQLGFSLAHSFLELFVVPDEISNAQLVEDQNHQQQGENAQAAEACCLPVRRDHRDRNALYHTASYAVGVCLLKIELVAS